VADSPIDPEDEEWRVQQLCLRAIGERLLLAGWASRVIDSDRGVGIGLTAKGVQRVNNLLNAIKELDPSTMRNEHFQGLFLYLASRWDETHPPSDS